MQLIKVINHHYSGTLPIVGTRTGTRYGKRKIGEKFYIREEDYHPTLFKKVSA